MCSAWSRGGIRDGVPLPVILILVTVLKRLILDVAAEELLSKLAASKTLAMTRGSSLSRAYSQAKLVRFVSCRTDHP